MKINFKLFAVIASIGLLFAAGCSKPEKKTSGASTTITITLSDVSVQTLTISLKTGGTAPSLVRLISPVTKEDFLLATGSLTDEGKVTSYLTRNGEAVSIPYEAVVKDLTPSTEYVVGAVAFDGNMDVCGWAVEEFKTLEFGSVTVGDASGAGSVGENILQ